MSTYDYIIIGAGSAGCVLANKLGADTSKSILILEAGPMDRDLMIHIPAGVYRAWRDPKLNWNYETEAEPHMDQRSIPMPRGRVVGGSSSINSMVYMRGHPLDFDGWARRPGLENWSYAHCLPYFRAGENYNLGGDVWRGDAGALGVTRGHYENPLFDAFVAAGGQAGQGMTDDANGFDPEGVSRLDATKQFGRRSSAAVAHLRPALRRANVTLKTGVHVEKILIENGRCVGVRCVQGAYSGRTVAVHTANDDVILAGGAINSPQVLMLSGIGPADHLREMDIDVVLDCPDVGQNLQDHANVIGQFECLKQFPIHRVDHPIRKALAGAQWVFTRDGVAASNIWEAGGMVRGNDSVSHANLHYHFGPVGFEYVGNKITLSQAFAIHVDVARPASRGHVRLKSANPMEAPAMTFNYYDKADDLRQMVEGVKKMRELVAQPAFNGLRGAEIIPGPDVQTDADIAAWVLQNSETDFHPSGTCRMGTVVDAEFRVIGIDGLRVVDASIMPRITSANLNAPTQMLAARAADYIAGRPQLDPIYTDRSASS